MTMLNPGSFDVIARAGEVLLVKELASHALYMAYERGDGFAEIAMRVTGLEEPAAPTFANTDRGLASPAPRGVTARRSRKETNKELAEALRALSKDRRGETWERAKMLLAQGKSVAEAAELA